MRYKLVTPSRAIVDDIELEKGGPPVELALDQVDRLLAIGVLLEGDKPDNSEEATNG